MMMVIFEMEVLTENLGMHLTEEVIERFLGILLWIRIKIMKLKTDLAPGERILGGGWRQIAAGVFELRLMGDLGSIIESIRISGRRQHQKYTLRQSQNVSFSFVFINKICVLWKNV